MKNLNKTIYIFVLGLILTSISLISPSNAGDRHAERYYPIPQSEENYTAALPPMPGVARSSRVGFVTELDKIQQQKAYPPSYHMFAKGAHAQKLIIVSTEEGRYNTIYRLRALLASLTATARLSPLFSKIGQADKLNFFDLLVMIGFEQLTITNGKDIAHQVHFVN